MDAIWYIVCLVGWLVDLIWYQCRAYEFVCLFARSCCSVFSLFSLFLLLLIRICWVWINEYVVSYVRRQMASDVDVAAKMWIDVWCAVRGKKSILRLYHLFDLVQSAPLVVLNEYTPQMSVRVCVQRTFQTNALRWKCQALRRKIQVIQLTMMIITTFMTTMTTTECIHWKISLYFQTMDDIWCGHFTWKWPKKSEEKIGDGFHFWIDFAVFDTPVRLHRINMNYFSMEVKNGFSSKITQRKRKKNGGDD